MRQRREVHQELINALAPKGREPPPKIQPDSNFGKGAAGSKGKGKGK
jgi:hypothetical protein